MTRKMIVMFLIVNTLAMVGCALILAFAPLWFTVLMFRPALATSARNYVTLRAMREFSKMMFRAPKPAKV
jgi:hypothetical protein